MSLPFVRYHVERLDKHTGRWSKISHDAINGLSISIKGLIENRQYAFRVNAENAAGLSKPSDESELIKASRPIGMCLILLSKQLKLSNCVIV